MHTKRIHSEFSVPRSPSCIDCVVHQSSSEDPSKTAVLAENRQHYQQFAEEEIKIWSECCRTNPDDWELLWTALQYARSYRVTHGFWRDSPTEVSNSKQFKAVG